MPEPRCSQRTLCLLCLLSTVLCLAGLDGCVSDEPYYDAPLIAYQQELARQGPQPRLGDANDEPERAREVLVPAEPEHTPPELDLDTSTDPNSGQKTVSLTLEQALTQTLANSPDIRVVSFDPEIARQDIKKAAADFDPVEFEQMSWDKQDAPPNSYFEPGQADYRRFETGIRQKNTLGSQWSASYVFARNWDDLVGRTLSTRDEPMFVFQLKQPLLRDAGPELNLAGVNIAKLQYQVALIGFRDKAESVAADVITAYWRLTQARRNLEIQQELVQQTLQTLHKVDSRREIDATDVQLMQARAYVKVREADLLDARKLVKDAQDALARLLAHPEVNTASDVTIVPVSAPEAGLELPALAQTAAEAAARTPGWDNTDDALATAMRYNPAVVEARLRIKIAEINVQVAKNQQLPRVDLVGSTRAQSLGATSTEAHNQLWNGQYVSYSVGLSIEIPLGNRAQDAELLRRQLEQHKAVSVLHSAADQVAAQVKEKARKARTTLEQIHMHQEAAQAALSQLRALEESEPVREKLTPEFLLVKLQAQETYAQARRAHVNALVEFHIAGAELARTTGTVLRLHRVGDAMATLIEHAED
jgi:outer membrane protein